MVPGFVMSSSFVDDAKVHLRNKWNKKYLTFTKVQFNRRRRRATVHCFTEQVKILLPGLKIAEREIGAFSTVSWVKV